MALICLISAWPQAQARAEPAKPGPAAPEAAFVDPRLVLEEVGVFCGPWGRSTRLPAPGTELGYIDMTEGNDHVTVATTTVPAVLGIALGLRFRASPGMSYRTAEFRVHRPSHRPRQRIDEHWSFALSPDSPTVNRFRFDFPRELNTGRWVMEVFLDGEILLRQGFDVVAPEAAPEVMRLCSGPPPLS